MKSKTRSAKETTSVASEPIVCATRTRIGDITAEDLQGVHAVDDVAAHASGKAIVDAVSG